MVLSKEPICDLCREQGAHLWQVVYGLREKRHLLWRCDSCELVFLHPQPAPETVLDYYSRGDGAVFHPLAREPQTHSLRDQVRTEIDRQIYFSGRIPRSASYLVRGLGWLAAWYFRYSRRHQKPPPTVGRARDIGYGDGKYLAWLRDVWGWQVHGVEPSAAAACFAGEVLKLDIHIGTLRNTGLPPESFDLVTMWDVLEHVPEPLRELREVARVLKRGGTLHLVVPNIKSWPARLFKGAWSPLSPPEHLFHFSERTLRAYLEKAGLQVETIGPVGSPHVARSAARRFVGNRDNVGRIAACLAWAIWPLDAFLNLVHIRGRLFAITRKVAAFE